MNKFLIKSTSVALMGLLYSATANASSVHDQEPGVNKTNLSAAQTLAKENFKKATADSLKKHDMPTFRAQLAIAKDEPWFGQTGLDWAFYLAANESCDAAIHTLLSFKNAKGLRIQPGYIKTVFEGTTKDDAKLSILDFCMRNDLKNPLLTQANLEDAFPKAVARGQLDVVKRLLGLPQNIFILGNECRLHSLKSAACWGQLPVVELLLQDTKSRGLLDQKYLNEAFFSSVIYHNQSALSEPQFKNIRGVVDFLLNMKEGPDQERVDLVFGQCLDKDLNLIKTMLIDPATNQLRKGMRPSDKRIRSLKDQFYRDEVRAFLNTLKL